MIRSAVISDDGVYRYSLGRRWGKGAPMVFVMLNPSTADDEIDDPTIRRCIGFAKRDNFDAIEVVNLYAYRATDPKALLATTHPIGAANADAIREAIAGAGAVVAAWGDWHRANNAARFGRGIPRLNVERFAVAAGLDILCLGKTKHGSPRHPLYVRADAPLVTYT